MKPDKNLFSLKNNFDAALVGLIGSLIVYLYCRYGGVGISPDSIVYASTARNVVHGNGFLQFDLLPTTDFPLGYPVFLSIIYYVTRIDPFVSGYAVNMVLFFSLIYLCGGILNHISTQKKWIKLPFLIIIAFSPTLLEVYTMLWSETLFLVLTLVFFIAIHFYGKRKTLISLCIVALVAGIACSVRLAGVTFIGAGLLLVLLDKDLKIKRKIVHFIFLGISSSLFLIANLMRNYFKTETLTGPREKSLTSFSRNFELYSNVITDFFQIHNLPIIFAVLVGVFFVSFYVFSHIVHLYKSEKYYNYWNICAVYFIVYVCFIVLSATFSRFETLNNRLLSPLFLPCLLPFSYIVVWFISLFSRWRKIIVVGGLLFLFSSIVYSQYLENYELYDMAKDCGIPGYAEDCWKESELFAYINNDKVRFNKNTLIYSDGNAAVYLFTGFPVKAIPHVENVKDIEKFRAIQNREYYIVWLYENESPELLSKEYLLRSFKLVKIASFQEGCIYYHAVQSDCNASSHSVKL